MTTAVRWSRTRILLLILYNVKVFEEENDENDDDDGTLESAMGNGKLESTMGKIEGKSAILDEEILG